MAGKDHLDGSPDEREQHGSPKSILYTSRGRRRREHKEFDLAGIVVLNRFDILNHHSLP